MLERAKVFFFNKKTPPGLLKRDPIKRKQETMHFKYNAKISEERDDEPHTAALRAYYS